MTAFSGARPGPLAAVAFAALSFFAAATPPSRACAQTARPSAGAKPATQRAKTAAQQHLQHGNELFRRDEIAGALAEFQAAFDLYPSPKLHFNLGQCERALGHADSAATHFERFLADASDISPELRAEAQRYLTEARTLVVPASEPAAAAEPPPEPAAAAEVEPVPAAVPLPAPAPPRQIPPVVTLPSTPPGAPPIYKRWWFWAAVGAVVVGGAITTFALARPRDPECGTGMRCY